MESFPDEDVKREDNSETTDNLINSMLYLNPTARFDIHTTQLEPKDFRTLALWFSPSSGMVDERYRLPCLKNMMGHTGIPRISLSLSQSISETILQTRVNDIMKYAYNHMLTFGYYDVAYSPNKMNAAYTTLIPSVSTPFLFMNATNTAEDMSTIVHEFGHYNAMYTNPMVSSDMDVSEIHSQAFELLAMDIYNEPINSFVADFIGESNIFSGTIVGDKQVRFINHNFECVDEFSKNEKVDVVIRPEDIDLVDEGTTQLSADVISVTFKGVHYEVIVDVDGFKWMIQTTDYYPVDSVIGIVSEYTKNGKTIDFDSLRQTVYSRFTVNTVLLKKFLRIIISKARKIKNSLWKTLYVLFQKGKILFFGLLKKRIKLSKNQD